MKIIFNVIMSSHRNTPNAVCVVSATPTLHTEPAMVQYVWYKMLSHTVDYIQLQTLEFKRLVFLYLYILCIKIKLAVRFFFFQITIGEQHEISHLLAELY